MTMSGNDNFDDAVPLLTRWSFEDFEKAYDTKFGRNVKISVSIDSIQSDLSESGRMINAPSSFPQKNLQTAVRDEGKDLQVASAIYEKFLPGNNGMIRDQTLHSANGLVEQRLTKSLPDFPLLEMRELVESITRDIVKGTSDVQWDSIKGLENAKRILKEAVVMPIKYPQYFTGLLSPWKGILLFGPPGTGKTMLAKAVASECNTTFFNISASSIVSKWRGDSEKLVKVLFELARYYAPSTIFLDEIDAIISQRGEANSEHEASRRLKTELLVQMDGLTQTDDLVFLLAATNLPWELDAAMLRRLEKRILVPLPEAEARHAMFEELLCRNGGKDLPFDEMVKATEGYSGSDLRIVCKEAAMRPLRRLMAKLESRDVSLQNEELPAMGPLTEDDIVVALKTTRPSAHLQSSRYDKFNSDFGSQADHNISSSFDRI